MCENKKEGRVKKGGVFFIIFKLGSETIPGGIKGMDFIHPERFFVKGIESQSRPYK
jgi:hypothetical protein